MTRHILVAVGVGYSKHAMAVGIERARESRARLTALHVVDRLPWWAAASIGSDCERTFAYIEDEANRIMQHSRDAMRDAGMEGACVTIDLQGGTTISRVIAQAARELDADLIVVGRSKTANWRFWEERVSDAVSRYSHRRVLIASDMADMADDESPATGLFARDASVTVRIGGLRGE